MKKQKTIDDLLGEHTALYKEFLPTLNHYSDMAKRLLEIQIQIFQRRLTEAQPKAKYIEVALLATISARETPAKLSQLLDTLKAKNVEVAQTIYDPMNFMFHLYGKA